MKILAQVNSMVKKLIIIALRKRVFKYGIAALVLFVKLRDLLNLAIN